VQLSGTKTVTMKPTKKETVKLSDHTPVTYLLMSTSLASCNLKNGFRRFAPHINVTITNSQCHKKRMLIIIHLNPSRSFFYSRPAQHMARESFSCSPRKLSKLYKMLQRQELK